MSDKYVVSQEFMHELVEWEETLIDNVSVIDRRAISNLPTLLNSWWLDGRVSIYENNNRLIAIIRWVNGEDVFEVEKPKKWVVRSKESDIDGDYRFVQRDSSFQIEFMVITDSFTLATKFDTKEEAESWANGHQEVVQVEVEE